MDINWIAILVSALMPMVLGAIWYHPKVFGGTWMEAIGFTEKDLEGGNMALIFGLSYVMSIITSMAIFIITNAVHLAQGLDEAGNQITSHMTFPHGMLHGAMIACFMVMPVLVTKSLFERRNIKYILLTVGYWMLAFALMGGITDVWR